MESLTGLNSDQIGKIGIGAIVAVVVIGLLVSMIISAIVGRLIVLVIVAALGIVIWQQRAEIKDHVKNCDLNMSFFGYDVQAPDDIVQQCKDLGKNLKKSEKELDKAKQLQKEQKSAQP